MLTAKQKAFCQEYLIDLNATQAAIRAGYSEKTSKAIGHENLTKPDVAARISELQAARQERTQVSSDYVIASLKEVADRCMQSVPVRQRGDAGEFEETAVYRFDHSGANKALELLGKHLGLFTDKHELSSAGGKPIDTTWTVTLVDPSGRRSEL